MLIRLLPRFTKWTKPDEPSTHHNEFWGSMRLPPNASIINDSDNVKFIWDKFIFQDDRTVVQPMVEKNSLLGYVPFTYRQQYVGGRPAENRYYYINYNNVSNVIMKFNVHLLVSAIEIRQFFNCFLSPAASPIIPSRNFGNNVDYEYHGEYPSLDADILVGEFQARLRGFIPEIEKYGIFRNFRFKKLGIAVRLQPEYNVDKQKYEWGNIEVQFISDGLEAEYGANVFSNVAHELCLNIHLDQDNTKSVGNSFKGLNFLMDCWRPSKARLRKLVELNFQNYQENFYLIHHNSALDQ